MTNFNRFTNTISTARNYLELIIPRNIICTLVRFNQRLAIEVIYLEIRKSVFYVKKIGDEFHYIVTCSVLDDCKECYLPAKYTNRPNTLKFFNLFSCKKISILCNLAKFINIMCKKINLRVKSYTLPCILYTPTQKLRTSKF
jgi:hypothetical protein